MPSPNEARAAGASALASLRQTMAEKAAEVLRRDPDRAAQAVEVGLIDRDWLDEPGRHPITKATPLEVIERFLERSVEQRPSLLASMGLNTIQTLSWQRDEDPGEGVPAPVTVVFTDLEGFTAFTAREGDEAASALLVEHHRAVGPMVRSRGGRVVKRLGDGLMLCFPEPHAAVKAALELVETAPGDLRLRAGLHFGEAVVTRDDVIGHVVNVAARVTESAKGGQARATTEVRDAVRDLPGVRFGRARRCRFKGLKEPVNVCVIELE